MRLIVAVAAPVVMLVAPGPIDDRHANVDMRLRDFAYAVAMCTDACSFLLR